MTSPPETFSCCICFEPHCVSLRGPCHHEFCAPCTKRIFEETNQKCPICRAPLPRQILGPNYTIRGFPAELLNLEESKIHASFPLICAAGNITDVELWLREHVRDVNILDVFGHTGLNYGVNTGHLPLVELLLQHGANVHQGGSDGFGNHDVCPLFLNAQQGDAGITRVLIEHDADINHVMWDGTTPLITSACIGHRDVVELLLHHNAEVNHKGMDNLTAIFLSSKLGHLATVELLLEHGADLNQPTRTGVTPLLISTELGHAEIVNCLLHNGAHVNHAANDGMTPLCTSVQNGHVEIAELLLQHNAEVNQVSSADEMTPLFMSAREGHEAMVEVLLQHGANVNQSRGDGKTPLMVSEENNHDSIVQLLRQYGAS